MIGAAQYHPEWKVIVELLHDYAYGMLVQHADIAELTKLEYPSPRYFQQVSRAYRTLRDEHQRVLRSVHGQGYRVLEPAEHYDEARRQLKFAGRRIKRGAKTIIAAPQHLLTHAQNARNAEALAKIGTLNALQQRTLRETAPVKLAARADVPKMIEGKTG